MAKQLDSFPDLPGHNKYDWENWLNGQPWEISKGEDFQVSIGSMRTQAYLAARTRGKKVRIRNLGPRTLAIQARPRIEA